MSNLVSILLLICLLTLRALALSNPLSQKPLLLVVGHVDTSSARILVDHGPGKFGRNLLNTRGRASIISPKPGVFQMFTFTKAPQILKFQNLEPNVTYKIQFEILDVPKFNNPRMDAVTFKTSDPFSKESFLVGSCNRVFEDEDVSTLEELAKRKSSNLGMVHLGDTVYCDWVVDFALKLEFVDAEKLVEKFRECYRLTWGISIMQNILRNGANWMLPDDHEVINNAAPEMWTDSKKSLILKAGLQVIQEYEYSLFADNDDCTKWKSFFPFALSSEVTSIFLDARFERVVNYDPKRPLLGEEQWKYVTNTIASSEHKSPIYIFSNIPLLFIPKMLTHIAYWFEKDTMATYPTVIEDTLNLLDLLCESGREVTIFAGDVHLFSHSILIKDTCSLRQIITSGLSKKSTAISSHHLYLYDVISMKIWSQKFDRNWTVKQNQVFLGSNFIEVSSSGEVIPFFNDHQLSMNQKIAAYAFEHSFVIMTVTLTSGVLLLAGIISICKSAPRSSRFKLKQL